MPHITHIFSLIVSDTERKPYLHKIYFAKTILGCSNSCPTYSAIFASLDHLHISHLVFCNVCLTRGSHTSSQAPNFHFIQMQVSEDDDDDERATRQAKTHHKKDDAPNPILSKSIEEKKKLPILCTACRGELGVVTVKFESQCLVPFIDPPLCPHTQT